MIDGGDGGGARGVGNGSSTTVTIIVIIILLLYRIDNERENLSCYYLKTLSKRVFYAESVLRYTR